MKIRPVGANLFHSDGRTDGHDEANSRFSQYCEYAKQRINVQLHEMNAREAWSYTSTHS